MGQAANLLDIGVAVEWTILGIFHEMTIFNQFPSVFVEDSVDQGDGKTAPGEILGGECQLGDVVIV